MFKPTQSRLVNQDNNENPQAMNSQRVLNYQEEKKEVQQSRKGKDFRQNQQALNSLKQMKQTKDNDKSTIKQTNSNKKTHGLMVLSQLHIQTQNCPICLKPILQKSPTSRIIITQCKHIFCYDCIKTFIEKNVKQKSVLYCPDRNCNKVINKQSQWYKSLQVLQKQQQVVGEKDNKLEEIRSEQEKQKLQNGEGKKEGRKQLQNHQIVSQTPNINNPQQRTQQNPRNQAHTDYTHQSQTNCIKGFKNCIKYPIYIICVFFLIIALVLFVIIFGLVSGVLAFINAIIFGPLQYIKAYYYQQQWCGFVTCIILYPIISIFLGINTIIVLLCFLICSPCLATAGIMAIAIEKFDALNEFFFQK